jgi:hypothetical protein
MSHRGERTRGGAFQRRTEAGELHHWWLIDMRLRGLSSEHQCQPKTAVPSDGVADRRDSRSHNPLFATITRYRQRGAHLI